MCVGGGGVGGHSCGRLAQGTLYPDVIESISYKGPSATIKSHHNVGGLLKDMRLKLVEPLRELFKDEVCRRRRRRGFEHGVRRPPSQVRALGMALGLPHESVMRHPFPGPGLAIRILGEVTREACRINRFAPSPPLHPSRHRLPAVHSPSRARAGSECDTIFLSELHAAGEYNKIGQAFCVLLPCKSVGVMGDARTYEQVPCRAHYRAVAYNCRRRCAAQVVAVRAVQTSDFMTADW